VEGPLTPALSLREREPYGGVAASAVRF